MQGEDRLGRKDDRMGTAAMAGGPREEEEEGVFDALIIGAGLSGINSAYRLQKAFPGIRYVVLEAREKVGGTWSFWQYPGVRSDSPLALFGLAWHPYKDDVNFADAGLIAEYPRGRRGGRGDWRADPLRPPRGAEQLVDG